ncbi:hypothetical protein QT17_01790 [Thermus sp. 2.9]|uniref:hypothetical protein n=1 Tax=Thermus sp. (strain 2.9) TaxID=1577051 RepID=UPI000543D0BD|nr:hypothetical protein [Thermus sp. 2.9]KHG66071.1 hypothetical protein QT17_01790 [Thermus sp. 2.9]
MTDLELAREVFRALAKAPQGLTREELARVLGVGDRQMRDAVALAAEKAAPAGYLLGMDPETGRYVLIPLNDPQAPTRKAQARRVLAYLWSYFETTFRRYSLMAEAFTRAYGEPPEVLGAAQPNLFQAALNPEALLREAVRAWERRDQAALAQVMEQAQVYLGVGRAW